MVVYWTGIYYFRMGTFLCASHFKVRLHVPHGLLYVCLRRDICVLAHSLLVHFVIEHIAVQVIYCTIYKA